MASFGPSNTEDECKWSIEEVYFQLLPIAYFTPNNIQRTFPTWPSPNSQRELLDLFNPSKCVLLTQFEEDAARYEPPLSYRKAVFRLLEKQIQTLFLQQQDDQRKQGCSDAKDDEEEEEMFADEFIEHCMMLMNQSTTQVPSDVVDLYGDELEDAQHIGYASYAVPFYKDCITLPSSSSSRHARIPICVKKTFNQVGTKVWGAGLFLAELFQYMSREPYPDQVQESNVNNQQIGISSLWKDKVILELGAGVGITGILIGRGLPSLYQPKSVIMTDCFEEVMNILRHNIDQLPTSITSSLSPESQFCELLADTIDWNTITTDGIQKYQANCMIAADCTYSEDLNLLLISVFEKYLCQSHDQYRNVFEKIMPLNRDEFLPTSLLQYNIPFVLIACTIRHPDTFQHFVTNLNAHEGFQVFDVSQSAHSLVKQPLYEYDFRSNIRLFCILAK